MNRRHFLFSASAVCTGCASKLTPPDDSPMVRAPVVGQSWRYARHDAITRKILEMESSRVASVGESIQIESTAEAQKISPSKHWNPAALFAHSRRDTAARALPSEIQKPWGMLLSDPHWKDPQVFQTAIPCWPIELRSGWSGQFHTKYETRDSASPLSWQLSMQAHGWETVAVPAGRFRSLRFTNLIDFVSVDPFRRSAQRRETIWFVPQIGRWAVRESKSTYYNEDSVYDQQILEDAYRWELLEWS